MLTLGNKLTLNSQPIYHFVNKYSIDFDGADQCITTDGADTVAQNTTYSFWIKSSQTGDNLGVFGHGSSDRGAFHINAYGTNKPLLYLGTDYYRWWNDITQQDDGEWHHWVVYLDTDINNCKLYVDSVLQTVDSTTSSGSVKAYTESLTIGGDKEASGAYFEGKIDEFAVYDRELTQAEITRMYNTYYSPNRVSNGNFATIGNEEVTNGDFSEIGAEIIVNGDFNGNADGWALDAGITYGNNNIVFATASNQKAIQTQTFTIGKTYKISIELVAFTSGTLTVRMGSVPEVIDTSTLGVKTWYIVATGNLARIEGTFGVGLNATVTNVSVKEVGQDWTFGASWSMGDGKAIFTTGSSSLLQQDIGVVAGKSYAVSLELTGSGGNLYLGTNTAAVSMPVGTYTLYLTAASGSNSSIGFLNSSGSASGTLDNVSVKEVGQGWTFGTGWSTDGTKATSDGTATNLTQNLSFNTNATYKVMFDITDYTSGAVRITLNDVNTADVNAVGFYSYDLTIGSSITTGQILIDPRSTFIGSIDNIVVQELKHDATNLMLNAAAYQSANPLITSTNSMEFDGADDYLTVADNSSLDFAAGFSVSFWAYPQAADSNDRMICKGVTGTGEWMISFGTGQAIRVYTKDDDDEILDFTSTNTLTVNEWAMVTVVVNRTTNYLQVYKNGDNLDESVATWTSGWSNSAALTIGVNSSLDGDFDGRMTEVGIYNRELTSLEVASLYNQGMPTNLLVNRNDYQSGNPTVFNTKQVDFDGSDEYLKANSTLGSITGSVSMWFKRDSTGNPMYLFDSRGTSIGGLGYIVVNSSVFTVSSGTRYVDGIAQTTMPTDANWHHAVVTGITLDIDEDIKIGSRYNEVETLEGNMSQVGLWNSTLTADEVSSLYNHGLPIDLTTNQAAYESSSNLVGYWRMGSGTLDTYPLIADQTDATLGSELVTNGDFATDSDWTKNTGWTISGGTANSDGGVSKRIYQDVSITASKTYRIDIDVNSITSGTVDLQFYDGVFQTITSGLALGTSTHYFTATSTPNGYIYVNSNSFVGSIDNVSVKQVQGNPAIMTNMASSDIENGSPYANIVQNSDFATDSDWAKGTGVTISDGKANWTNTANNIGVIQSGIITSGKTYKISYTVSNFSSGSIRVRYPFISDTITANGTYTATAEATSTDLYMQGETSSDPNVNLSIDNVTVEEVNTGLQGYWKMGDGTNDEYPVIYDQVDPTLGSELVTNGDFATNLDGWTLSVDTPPVWYQGMMKMNSDGATFSIADQSFTTTSGKDYLLVFEKLLDTQNISILVGTSQGSSSILNLTLSTIQYYYYTFTATSSTTWLRASDGGNTDGAYLKNFSVKELNGNYAFMTNMVEGNITNQYPLTKIRNYWRMGDGILDGFPIIQDQTSPNLAHIPTTNTLHYSEDFSEYQTGGSTIPTLTSGQLAPDGTLTATKVVGVIGDSSLYISGISSVTACRSMYARTVTGTGTSKLMSYNTNSNNTFTLTEEWQRFELTGSSATGGTNFYAIDFRGSQTLSELIIWGAQSEEQHQATAYLKSDGVASVRKATTTNILTYSEDFSEWTIDGSSSITSNATTSPIGTSNATKLIAGSVSGRQAIKLTSSNSGDLAFSVYAKKSDYSFIQFSDGQDASAYANFDLNTGVVGSSSVYTPTIINIGNGWYRCIATFDAAVAINNVRIGLITSSTSVRVENFSGDGTSGVYIWGSQLEEQTQVETYAKTTGLPVTIDLYTENNYGTMTNMVAGDIVEDTP